METALNEFQPFKAPRPDGLYPVLLQKGWNQLKGLPCHFSIKCTHKVLIKCTVTSITVLNCIRNLNQLGKQNHVSIAWILGHTRVHGNEVADYLRYSYEPSAWKECTRIFLPKPGKESYFKAKIFRMTTLTSFQLKWLERLILYYINEDNNVQAKLSA